jgi:hypothetical protein
VPSAAMFAHRIPSEGRGGLNGSEPEGTSRTAAARPLVRPAGPLADDIDGDGILDSNRQTADVFLRGQTLRHCSTSWLCHACFRAVNRQASAPVSGTPAEEREGTLLTRSGRPALWTFSAVKNFRGRPDCAKQSLGEEDRDVGMQS